MIGNRLEIAPYQHAGVKSANLFDFNPLRGAMVEGTGFEPVYV